jgi:hypothetical protein
MPSRWTARNWLLDVTVPLQTAERSVDGALDLAGAPGELLKRKAHRRISQRLEGAYELVDQLDVVRRNWFILLGRIHLRT